MLSPHARARLVGGRLIPLRALARRGMRVFFYGLGMGTFTHQGTYDLLAYALGAIKRVRLVHRADGYYAQFVADAERHVSVEPTGGSAQPTTTPSFGPM